MRDGAKAYLRMMIKHVLRRHRYPPDKQGQATQTVVAQAETMALDAVKLKARTFSRRPLISTTASLFTETRRKVLPLKLYHYHFYAIY